MVCRSQNCLPARCFVRSSTRVLMGGYFAGLLDRFGARHHVGHETWRGLGWAWATVRSGDHRMKCPLAGCRVGAGVLRPRKRRAMRLCFNGTAAMLQSPGRCATPPRPTRIWPGYAAGQWCFAVAAHARRLSRDQYRREPVGEVPRPWSRAISTMVADMPTRCVQGRTVPTSGGGEPV